MQHKANVRLHFTEKATGDTGTIDMFFASASIRMDNLSPDTAWIEYDEFWEWANQSPHLQYGNCEWIGGQTEGDLEQRQAEQEQEARKAKAEGNPRTIQEQINREVELFGELVEPFGPNWQRDMMGYNKFDLVQALKNCLQRAEKSRQGERAADAEIVRLQAENNRLRMESGEMFTELSAHHSTPEAKEARILAWGEVDRLKAVVDAKDAEIVRLWAELAATNELLQHKIKSSFSPTSTPTQ